MAASTLLLGCLILSLLLLLRQQPASAVRAITSLPGFDGPLPFSLQTGYVEVDEADGVHLFYYFIQSERRPAEDPLLLWLTGGPGCSAFSGLAFEIGPLKFDVAGYTEGLPTLVYDPISWTKFSNVIFLDSPIGTGFTYSDTEQGYRSSDTKAVGQILTFLSKWFDDHKEFKSNPLYITGDSYSGKIIPIVAFEIAKGKNASDESFPNLKGYSVGNPLADPTIDWGSRVPFAHGMGLISDELYESAQKSCAGLFFNPTNAQCANFLQAIDKCTEHLNVAQILEPLCTFYQPHPYLSAADRRKLRLNGIGEFPRNSGLPLECRTSGYLLARYWANDYTVREALGIRKGTVPSWLRCNDDILYTWDVQSAVPYHLNLTSSGYRALVYSGDHDMYMPFLGTQAWIRSLNFSIVDDWRPWSVAGQVAGFTRTYSNNLTFATVKGAGHTAPEYKPNECLAMIERWLSGVPL